MLSIELLLLIGMGVISLMAIQVKFTPRQLTAALMATLWQFQLGMLFSPMCGYTSKHTYHAIWLGDLQTVPVVEILANALWLGALPILFSACSFWKYKNDWARTVLIASVLLIPIRSIAAFSHVTATDLLMQWWLLVIPAVSLGILTLQSSHIYLRNIMQCAVWVCTLLWWIPSLLFSVTLDNWQILFQRNITETLILGLPLFIPAALLAHSVYLFAKVGNGTPFPYDPPINLVTKGIYAYVSNPMQIGICLLMFLWGVFLNNLLVSVTGLVAVALFIVFSHVCNGSCKIGLNNPAWIDYQESVSRWWPNHTRYKAQ